MTPECNLRRPVILDGSDDDHETSSAYYQIDQHANRTDGLQEYYRTGTHSNADP